jgi:hypothetical protein
VYLPASLTTPGRSGSARPTRLRRGCSRPSRRPSAQASSSFTLAAATARRRGPFTPVRSNSASWRTLYITSLGADETTPADLLAHVRGHWRVEHAHWLRDVIWKEDKSLIRTGNGPQIWSVLANLVIILFRIHGVTSYTAETRRCAQDPRRAL